MALAEASGGIIQNILHAFVVIHEHFGVLIQLFVVHFSAFFGIFKGYLDAADRRGTGCNASLRWRWEVGWYLLRAVIELDEGVDRLVHLFYCEFARPAAREASMVEWTNHWWQIVEDFLADADGLLQLRLMPFRVLCHYDILFQMLVLFVVPGQLFDLEGGTWT